MADERADQSVEAEAAEERTTKELILTLGDDVDRSHEALLDAIDAGSVDEDRSVSADYPFFARQLVRAVFAYIEAITFSVKMTAVDHCRKAGIDIPPEEIYLAVEVDHVLSDKGEVIQQRAMLRLAPNIRFAFALAEKAFGIETRFDPSVEWWSCLKAAIKVRDRLMHPRMPEDIDISGDEIVAVLKAKSGFESLVHEYGSRKPDLPGRQ